MSARPTPAPSQSGPVGETLWAKLNSLSDGRPCLTITDPAGKTICKLYVSPDERVLRIVMPELSEAAQVKIDEEHHLIDISRHF